MLLAECGGLVEKRHMCVTSQPGCFDVTFHLISTCSDYHTIQKYGGFSISSLDSNQVSHPSKVLVSIPPTSSTKVPNSRDNAFNVD